MKRKWVIKEKISDEIVKKFPDYHPVILQLLHNRGLSSAEEIAAFLNPRYENLTSPFFLTDMDKAVERILGSVASGEKITIYADYDADAVTACAVVYRLLSRLGARLDWYIPDRFTEGYGLNREAVAQIAESGAKLLITVDCGINAVEEVEQANSRGLEAIITDHHHITGNLPNAAAVINPKRDLLAADLHGLTGVGVAFKLLQGLMAAIYPKEYESICGWKIPEKLARMEGLRSRLPGERVIPPVAWEKWLLDLVAVGTIADCQNLMGENRILVKYGLRVLAKTKWLGLREIIKNAGIDEHEEFDTYDVGFIISPRINAAGRIQHADIAFRLLTTDDPTEAAMYAGQLESLNAHRQRLTEQILSEARAQVEHRQDNKVLLAVGNAWPKGVIGLVAGRLAEEFYRPTIVLERDGNVATGSARSVGGFDIMEALSRLSRHLVRFGGHSQAAGLTLNPENIEGFYADLLNVADELIDPQTLVYEEVIDALLDASDVDDKLIGGLKQFEPFGLGNPNIKFLLKDLTVERTRLVGNAGKHLKLFAASAGRVYEFIGFGHGARAQNMIPGDNMDIVVEPSHNFWNGQRKIQLKIKDIRKV